MACGSRSDILWLFCHALAYGWVLMVAQRDSWDWFDLESRSFIIACRSPANVLHESNVTGLKVILPSVGQTGTTSMTDALRELGLRTYHNEDLATMAKMVLKDGVTPILWANTVSRCRMDALALEPLTDMLPLALSVSPWAKVLLTWRDFDPWQRSAITAGIGRDQWMGHVKSLLRSATRVLPWVQLVDHWTGIFSNLQYDGAPPARPPELFSFLHKTLFFSNWQSNIWERGTYKVFGQEEAYLAHIDEIRRITPPGRLLEVDIRTATWREIEEFLGLPPTKGDGRLPRSPRSSKVSRTNDPDFNSFSPQVLLGIGILCSLHVANYWAVMLLARASILFCAGLCSCCCGLTSLFKRMVSYPVLTLCGLCSRR